MTKCANSLGMGGLSVSKQNQSGLSSATADEIEKGSGEGIFPMKEGARGPSVRFPQGLRGCRSQGP
jgi:hypothetical protein